MLKFTFEPQSYTLYSKKFAHWVMYRTTIPVEAEIKTHEDGWQYVELANMPGVGGVLDQRVHGLLGELKDPDGVPRTTFVRLMKTIFASLAEGDDPPTWVSWMRVDGPKLIHRVESIGHKFFQYDTENMELLHYDKAGNAEVGEAVENTSLLRAAFSWGQDIFFEQCDYTRLTSYVRLRERSAAIELWSAYKNTSDKNDIERVFGPVKFHDHTTTEERICE